MFGQLKLKRFFLEGKKIENTKICCYQNLNSNANSLNETDFACFQFHSQIEF